MRRRILSTVLITVALMITGCTRPAPEPSSEARVSATPTPAPAAETPQPFPRDRPAGDPRGMTSAQQKVDRRSADAVAEAFVVRLELWDSRLDQRPNDAARRAAPYATPELRKQLLAGQPDNSPGERWTSLTAHHGWTTVTTRLGGTGEGPPTTATSAVRAVTPIAVDHGNDGWASYPDTPGTYIVALHRAREAQLWAVSGYTIQ